MRRVPDRCLLWSGLAAALLSAAAEPCAGRGTGGFLREWAVCGPIKGTRLDSPDLPATFVAYPGFLACGAVWLPAEAQPQGRIDLRALYPEPQSGTALLHTFFECPADATYTVRVGSDDAVRVDIDGRTVHRHDVRRPWSADQDKVRVNLARGWHRMLVRVVDYGGDWAVSVRMAGAKDQPLDVRHQAACPHPLEDEYGLSDPVTVEERAEAVALLAADAARLVADLEAALPRLAETPEGYITFAEYEGARNLGRTFFGAMASLWREAVAEELDAEAVRAAQHMAVEAARGFSEVLALETDGVARSLVRRHQVWETPGKVPLSRRAFAAATLEVAELLARSRRLATQIEDERIRNARLENDIRNWRQRDVRLHVVDAEGRPLPGVEVEVVQQRHDFGFGCNLFAFRRWGDAKKNALYERRFQALFNSATVPLYWSVLEKRRGRPDVERLDAAVAWCRERGIAVTGHPLFWEKAVPPWVGRMPPDEARDAVRDHVRQTVSRYRETVAGWDVVYAPRERLRVGRGEIETAQVLRWAADAQPHGRLLLCGDDPETLVHIANAARHADTRLDGIGLTAHQHDGAWSLRQVRRTLNQCGAAGRPIHVSAVTLLGRPETEAEQAEAVRHFYTAAFAHPKVASITWWDLSDRFAWQNAPAGLLRADLSPKPAYKVLDRLINHLWRTDAAGRTDARGRVTVRAFFGTHRITAQSDGRRAVREVHLGRDGPDQVEIVLPPTR